ncbi:MAG: hypothetical protein U0528_05315 [Anaerolineae bacterium]
MDQGVQGSARDRLVHQVDPDRHVKVISASCPAVAVLEAACTSATQDSNG